jgi:hypothetical protein
VRKNTIPRSISIHKMTVIRPSIENSSGNAHAVTIKDASIKAKTARKIVEIITPVVQTHAFFIIVP